MEKTALQQMQEKVNNLPKKNDTFFMLASDFTTLTEKTDLHCFANGYKKDVELMITKAMEQDKNLAKIIINATADFYKKNNKSL